MQGPSSGVKWWILNKLASIGDKLTNTVFEWVNFYHNGLFYFVQETQTGKTGGEGGVHLVTISPTVDLLREKFDLSRILRH